MIQALMTALVVGGLASFLPRRVAVALLATALAFLLSIMQVQGSEPAASRPYQRALLREGRLVFGLGGPMAMFAGQIEQESGWRPDVCSTFACGLAQFTPATAQWISGAYKTELGNADVLNPDWAIRAMLRYDARLFGELSAADDCERWAFVLSAYNGGLGWVIRDRRLCAGSVGCDPARWFGQVERTSPRSPTAMKENRGYPQRILKTTQFHYTAWGRVVSCSNS